MRKIFVMDIKGGVVVHGIRGERDRYEPIERFSRVVSSSDPLRMVEELKPKEVYVADLDAIERRGNNFELIREISRRIPLMADCGIRSKEDIEKIRELGCTPILGTETAERGLFKIAEGCVASVDMREHRILGGWRNLQDAISYLNETPVREIIILDISRVGTERGWKREEIEEAVEISEKPVLIGGGIRKEDLEILERCGVAGVLVSTAVHLGEMEL